MIRDIVFYPDPVLRKVGSRVEDVTPEIRQLAADMIETMYDAHGVGLAAHQVGVSVQLAVIDVSHDEDGLFARAIQHEVDHLFGKLFIDRMSSARKLAIRRQLKEMQDQYG